MKLAMLRWGGRRILMIRGVRSIVGDSLRDRGFGDVLGRRRGDRAEKIDEARIDSHGGKIFPGSCLGRGRAWSWSLWIPDRARKSLLFAFAGLYGT